MFSACLPSAQHIAWFLSASLRLCAFDITNVVTRLLPYSEQLRDWPQRADPTDILNLMLQRQEIASSDLALMTEALRAIMRPVWGHYGHELIPAFGDMKLLDDLEKRRRISAAEQNIKGKWLVMAARTDRAQFDAIRLFQPSFFMGLQNPVASNHVHFLDLTVASHQSVILLTFNRWPRRDTIRNACNQVGNVLGLRPAWRWTEPMFHNQSRTLFRADGMIYMLHMR